ncbi:MAG: Beta-barrel assembly-enhancing protease [Nitrospirae bacterium]|nr:MAG: putative peptidase M48, Ste24p [Nitrospira sp. OLB3]MBV6468841.1 Beta-barrel assembly-enhancing protease [Nitrospirota bacterium]MCK6498504.1 M48 family metallopeptidase [Nitrospira sp.]MEB2340153.1 M48 family metallopeptidase [Nitrospirales bacterium]
MTYHGERVTQGATVKRSSVFWLMMGVAVLLTTTGCQTNPYTGRWQLMMMPMSQETQMGAQAYAQVKSDPKMKQSTDPREIEPVRRVAARVIEAAKRSKYSEMANQFEWEVTVIKDDKTMNAFALPGGKIAVYTGIFPVAKTEAGLAAVMGHEVVHALARHGGERMSQNTLAQTTLQAIGIALGVSGTNPVLTQGAMAALGVGAQVGVLLPFSRKHESEADYVGVLLAAEAGYDPRESIQLWTRMGELSGGKGTSEFLSTHPSHDTRIQQLEEWMAEALPIYQSKPPAPNSELPQLR